MITCSECGHLNESSRVTCEECGSDLLDSPDWEDNYDTNEDLNFDEGGTYTSEDRKLYCYKGMKKGTKVKHKNKTYTVMESKDYSDFDIGLFVYVLKRGGND